MKTIVAVLDIWSVRDEYAKDQVQANASMKILHDICGEIWFLSETPWTPELEAWKKRHRLNQYKCIIQIEEGGIPRLIKRFKTPKNWKAEMVQEFIKQKYIIYTSLVHVETVLFFDHNEENRQAILAMNNQNVRAFSSFKEVIDAIEMEKTQNTH